MTTENMTKEQREEYWQLVVDDFNESNVTKTEYCRKNEIAVSTFNYWESRLSEAKEVPENRFVELSASPKVISSLTDCGFKTEAVIALKKVRVLINSDTPKQLIKAILETVAYAE